MKAGIEESLARFNLGTRYKIADVASVGLPAYELKVRALTLAHKPLAAIDEYVLRSMRAGVTEPREIGQFLGLDDYPLERSLVALAQQELIALTAPRGRQTWRLTDKGVSAVEAAEIIAPEQQTLPILFDAILWKPVPPRYVTVSAKQLEGEGCRAIELVPPRRPRVSDLRADAIERVIEAIRPFGLPRRQVLSVLDVLRLNKRYIPATAVLYRAWEGSEFHIGFIVDGQRSDGHELQFAGTESFRRMSSEWSEVSVDDAELALALEEADRLEQTSSLPEVRGALRAIESRLTLASGAADAEDEIEQLNNEVERLRAELLKPDIRFLEMPEHPPILSDAIANAQERLMIISPWMTTEVVSDDFVSALEATLKRGVRTYIGYGMNDQSVETVNLQPKAERARERLRSLSEKYPNFRFVRLGATHSKVLVKDDEFAVVTSFNWLSFRGDPKKRLRDEQGVLVRRASKVNEKWESQIHRFG